MKLTMRVIQLSFLMLAIMHSGSSQSFWKSTIVKDNYIGQNRYGILRQLSKDYQFQLKADRKLFEYDILVMPTLGRQLDSVIMRILEPTELYFQFGNRILEISEKPFERIDYSAIKKNVTVTGQLKDSQSSEALPFATVVIKGTTNGTVTNQDGYFTLFNVPTDSSTLQVQYLGYELTDIKLDPILARNSIEIRVRPMSLQLEEIVISSQSDNVFSVADNLSQVSLSPAQLNSIPNLGERDIFRAFQLLPGVSGTNESSSGLYVRGGTPDQNLVLFDGFTVYHVDHFYGFFSAFNSEAIKDVQMYKGGFGAKYGGRLSSVMDITGKNGSSDLTGGFGLSAISATANFEGPIGDRLNFFLAARRSYTDVIQSGLYDKIFDLYNDDSDQPQQNQGPQGNRGSGRPGGGRGPGGFAAQEQVVPDFFFYDLNAKLSYRPTDKDIISFSILNGQDNLDNSRTNTNELENFTLDTDITDLLKWGNRGASLRWARQWNANLYTNLIVAGSNYFSERDRLNDINISREDTSVVRSTGFVEDNQLNDLSVKSFNEINLGGQNTLTFGGDFTYLDVNYDYTLNDTINIFNQSSDGTLISGYIQDHHRLGKLEATAGVRSNYYDVTDRLYIEPRFSLNYLMTDRFKLKGAWGVYHQFVNRIVREDVTQGSRDFWLLADGENNVVSRSTHLVLGLSYETKNWLFDIETFEKPMEGLAEFSLRFQGARGFSGSSSSQQQLFFQGDGIARGVEFLIQRKTGDLTGWIGYTLSEVVHDFPDISDNQYYALHDQRNELKGVASYDLNRWNFGATWVYGSGTPYTAPYGEYTIELLDGTSYEYVSVGEKNAFRLPPYHRLDVSATYNFKLGDAKTSTGLSIFNLYNRENIWYKEFEVVDEEIIETNVNYIGITPSVFFNIKF